MKHTKGPWKLVDLADIGNPESVPVHFSSLTFPHSCDDPDCPGAGNMRKLEVFEEMLEALKDARFCLSEFSKRRQVYDGPLSEVYETIRAVIAKAKGE